MTFSVTAYAEPVRTLRFINILFGIGICCAPFIFGVNTDASLWVQLIGGILVIGLSIPKGKIVEAYGSWNRFIV